MAFDPAISSSSILAYHNQRHKPFLLTKEYINVDTEANGRTILEVSLSPFAVTRHLQTPDSV